MLLIIIIYFGINLIVAIRYASNPTQWVFDSLLGFPAFVAEKFFEWVLPERDD